MDNWTSDPSMARKMYDIASLAPADWLAMTVLAGSKMMWRGIAAVREHIRAQCDLLNVKFCNKETFAAKEESAIP